MYFWSILIYLNITTMMCFYVAFEVQKFEGQKWDKWIFKIKKRAAIIKYHTRDGLGTNNGINSKIVSFHSRFENRIGAESQKWRPQPRMWLAWSAFDNIKNKLISIIFILTSGKNSLTLTKCHRTRLRLF